MKKRLLVFASGGKIGGGTGFRKLSEFQKSEKANYKIVGVISNHENGGVAEIAKEFEIEFKYFPGPYNEEEYRKIFNEFKPDFISLSGWIKLVIGHDPSITFNNHPSLLPLYGGKNMYGIKVHEKVIEDFNNGLITQSGFTIHFADEAFDKGAIIFQFPVKIEKGDTAESLQKRIISFEHLFQAEITNLIVMGDISWDGKNKNSLKINQAKIDEILKLAA